MRRGKPCSLAGTNGWVPGGMAGSGSKAMRPVGGLEDVAWVCFGKQEWEAVGAEDPFKDTGNRRQVQPPDAPA